MRQPVGVIGERGFLRQHRQAGQQRGGGVGEQVIDVRHPPGPGELEGEQGQQPAGGGDDARAGVASRPGQGGQVQGDQVGQDQQQPGPHGVQPLRPGIPADDLGPGQVRVAAGSGRRDAGLGFWAAQQAAEPLLGEDLPDRSAVERGALAGQPGGDLIGGKALAAQLGHPSPGGVFGRGGAGRAAGPARRGEQRQLPGPVLAREVHHRPAGVAEPGPGLGVGKPVHEIGAQRLIPPLVHLARRGEELRPWPLR
jgi:hypothetical protein